MSRPFYDRLKKRVKHLSRWASRWPTQAWRAYDRDIPEYPWTVDVYLDRVVLQCFWPERWPVEPLEARRQEVVEAVEALLEPVEIVHKQRERQRGEAQYERLAQRQQLHLVSEGPVKLWVNLHDYIDTGLFLDHRELRRVVAQQVQQRVAQGRPARLLNLFCYTGAFSAWAGLSGAQTTSVDLSNTYLDWTRQNLEVNGLSPSAHVLERSDVTRWLPQQLGRAGRGRFDLIVLDPPTFSRSKKMVRDLDIQRDHGQLIRDALALLSQDGTLYFSTNFQGFVLEEQLSRVARVQEITSKTVPEDFRTPIHRAWRLEPKG